MDHVRTKALRNSKRRERLQGLNRKRNSEDQTGGYNQEPCQQKDRTDIEAIDDHEGGGQWNQNSEICEGSGDVSGNGAGHEMNLDEASLPWPICRHAVPGADLSASHQVPIG